MSQPSIGDFALVGDTRTAALCSSDGSIDWLCLPRFDSEPIFGRLVGGAAAASFSIQPERLAQASRRYRSNSAVLETRWWTDTGEATFIEGMVVEVTGALLPQTLLVRRVECGGGRVGLRVCFDPQLGLPGREPRAHRRSGALVCEWGSLAVALRAEPELELVPGRETMLDLDKGQAATFVLAVADRSPLVIVPASKGSDLLEATDGWWRGWSRDVSYDGPFREALLRSLITLRLLTYSPSGAPVAAPTTSLPEVVGGSRNWDYRFSWPRDASIGLAAFLAVGKDEEAHSFMHWLLHASRLTRPRLEVLYTLYGKPGPDEREIEDATGYRGSRPVRVGNGAGKQHQLDVYGWVLDAGWLMASSGRSLHGETWRALSGFADFVAEHWREPDAGIWEVRGDAAHYVQSKLMAWLAVDRALRIGESHRTRASRTKRWSKERDALASDIRARGFHEELGSYVWAYGRDELDAALLVLPVLEFEEQGSAKVRGTVEAVRRELGAGGPLLYRYPPGAEGLEGVEGAFLPCSFWLVQALARLGKVGEAEEMFEELLGLSNDVGLFAEEMDPSSKEHLGNFPQAFTHATLVQAVLALARAQAGERKTPSSVP